jgi:tRNA/tmRNA/rRNA uracil-C5-methylase (TrmA/RlmC/RlmD family)
MRTSSIQLLTGFNDVMEKQQGKKRRRRGIAGRVDSTSKIKHNINGGGGKESEVESSPRKKKVKTNPEPVQTPDKVPSVCGSSSIANDSVASTNNMKADEKAASNSNNQKEGRRRRKRLSNNNNTNNDSTITRTKLRNLLKRRAAKKKKQGALGGGIDEQHSIIANGEELNNDDGNKMNRSSKKKQHTSNCSKSLDPSCVYINNPQSAPVVRRAISYMKQVLNPSTTKRKEKMFHITTGPIQHWRTVSKMAVRRAMASSSSSAATTIDKKTAPSSSQLQIGLFKPKSHDIIPVPYCTAHHPSINMAVPILQEACTKCNVQAFSEQDGTGQLRYLAINVERSTGAVQITLVWNDNNITGSGEDSTNKKNQVVLDSLIQTIIDFSEAPTPKVLQESATKVEEKPKEQRFKLHSLWVHYHATSKHDNAIFGRDENSWRCFYGPTSISESIDITNGNTDNSILCPYKVTLEFPPNVFRQANIDAFARIIGVIRKRIVRYNTERLIDTTTNEKTKKKNQSLPSCVELYGGVGTIGLHLVDLTSKLVSSDENPYNVACFEKAASNLPKNLRSRVSYVPKNAAQMTLHGALKTSELCIVDPPRKGLDKEVLDALVDNATSCFPKLLVYVSCGFPAFERDCNRILQSKEWSLEHAEGFLLFPGSDAIETLAFFTRNK